MITALNLGRQSRFFLASACLVIAVSLAFFGSREPVLTLFGLLVLAGFVLFCFKPFWGIIAVVFLLPFERIGAYDYAGITVRPSQVVAIVLLIVWLVQRAFQGRLAWQKQPIFWPVVFFLGINAIGLANSENLQRSVMVFGFTAFTLIVGLLIPQIITSEQHLKIAYVALAVTTLLVSAFGIFQFLGDLAGLPNSVTGLRELYTKAVLGFPRVQSTALEPLYFANFLIFPISLFVARLFGKIKTSGLLGLPLLMVSGLVFVLTVARGGYFGLLASVLVIFLLSWRQILNPGKVLALFASGIIIAFAAMQLLGSGTDAFSTQKFGQHIQALFTGASFEERVATFDLANQAFHEQPWVGIGPGQFGPYASINPFFEPEDGWKIVNNLTLELLAETGILGLLAMACVFIVIFWRSLRVLKTPTSPNLRAFLIGGTAALVGILVQYQTFSILYIMHVWVAIGLVVAAQNIILKQAHVDSGN
ncbi:hypothetical protein C4546_00975 [Candidatus Parcubacteria bacterium]|jgi:O-antigen ligase|nr:MAG: hypothetical protein C4546_00975 [Candidatus Parcubacteria bacterium]